VATRKREPATAVGADPEATEVGSVFVSNYPPYSFWSPGGVDRARQALEEPPAPNRPLGLYVHIPFCRKRCKFCYFRVLTDRTSGEVQTYLDAVQREIRLYSELAAIRGRPLTFIYFGGGTPSFLSSKQLGGLVDSMKASMPWDGVEEVAFECEPGTLTEHKVQTIRELGITRLSLGVENFDDTILAENGRAHLSREVYRVIPWIEAAGFDQVNIDLIAGMVGESWGSWKATVHKTIDMGPDSVTVYQMELPYNTVYSGKVLDGGGVPVADWATKRAWHDHAFEQLAAAGYEISSAYTMVKRGNRSPFVYRNSVWRGCDLVGAGVSSFSHVSGIHYQNISGWEGYLERVGAGELPIDRGFAPSDHERMTRELILQLKLGQVETAYFSEKFGVAILEEFAGSLDRLRQRKMLEIEDDRIRLTHEGLLRVDSLLPEFYAPEYQNARYT